MGSEVMKLKLGKATLSTSGFQCAKGYAYPMEVVVPVNVTLAYLKEQGDSLDDNQKELLHVLEVARLNGCLDLIVYT